MTPRNTKRQRLEAAGYIHVAGWLPTMKALVVEANIASHREEVHRIAETHKSSGRPKAEPPK